jgi:hypothetical protein
MRAAAPVDPEAARRAAQRILSDRRFRSAPTPRPLRGPLHWLGDRLDALFGPVGRLISSVTGRVWLVALGVVVAAIVWIVIRHRRRRLTTAPAGRAARVAATDTDAEDPDALERAADAAERDGDLAGAVRTTLRSQRFDDLAGTFEAVAYGGREPDRPDVDASRREWPRVLEETGRK